MLQQPPPLARQIINGSRNITKKMEVNIGYTLSYTDDDMKGTIFSDQILASPHSYSIKRPY
uniref:Uncharacterized protein n=1 Tax=Arundo donax TaxID=35708 RepID=A0A0A9BNG9_ARUDO